MKSSTAKPLIIFLSSIMLVLNGCSAEIESTGRRGTPGGSAGQKDDSASSGSRRAGSKRRARKKGTKEKLPGLTEQDFLPSTETNRDPFRSFLHPEAIEVEQVSFEDTRVVLLERYELAELRLTGIVGGRSRLAMFRSPDNRTTNVSKGVRLTKSRALIVEVAEDHVILQIPQLTEGQKPTFVERIIWVDPNRKIVEIGNSPLRADEEGIRYSGRRRSNRSRRIKERE